MLEPPASVHLATRVHLLPDDLPDASILDELIDNQVNQPDEVPAEGAARSPAPALAERRVAPCGPTTSRRSTSAGRSSEQQPREPHIVLGGS
jgi:hypothetical protein